MPIPPDVPPVSTASPGSRSPAPSIEPVPSLTPAMTGIPGRSPSAPAASARSQPSGCPNGSGCGTCDGRTPAASSASGANADSCAWSVWPASPVSHSPSASQLVEQPARLGGRVGILAGEPLDLRQQPEAAAADPPVLPRDRGPERPRVLVDDRERRALPDDPDRDDVQPLAVAHRRPVRSRARPTRTPATSRAGPARHGRPAPARCGSAPGRGRQRPVEPDEDRLRLARPEIQPEDGPGHAGVVTRRRPTTASRPDRPPRSTRPRGAGTSAGPRSPGPRRPASNVGPASGSGGRASSVRASAR